jgi:hypothetical protein
MSTRPDLDLPKLAWVLTSMLSTLLGFEEAQKLLEPAGLAQMRAVVTSALGNLTPPTSTEEYVSWIQEVVT